MLTLKIAFRNVLRNRRRSFFTILTILGGCALSVLSIGWSDGSYSHIIDAFTRNRLGHIQVHKKGYLDKPSIYNTIDDYRAVGDKIMSVKGVESWAPRIFCSGLVSFGSKTAGVRITGIDPALEQNTTKFGNKIIKGKNLSADTSHKVVLGKGLAKILNADLGSELVVVTQGADGSLANDIYRVCGIADTGDYMADRTAFYLNLKDAQELLVLYNRVHEIAVVIDKPDKLKRVIVDINKALNDSRLSVESWQEFAKDFYRAMKVDQEGMWIFLLIIMTVVAFGVLNTILMSILERRREYGVLKAVGTNPADIVKMIIYEANVLALISIIAGIAVGTLANYFLSVYGFSIPEPITYGGIKFDKMYAMINLRSIYIPAFVILVTTTIVSIFPALMAAKTDPAKTMRMH
ncbi:MAG: ABC transporter permease [Elusimicrobia bacterium]|nr:ABC transporter permease [Elusimicrobiota bacterium]